MTFTVEDIKKGEKYPPKPFVFKMGLTSVQSAFCFDQAKANFFWLVEPRVDAEGLDAARDNPIAEDIQESMDHETRAWLQKLPLKFLDYWEKAIRQGPLNLEFNLPPDYMRTMTKRAHEAQTRLLCIVDDGNVRRVNFRRAG